MPDSALILMILTRTPLWVWGVFAALLALGLSQLVRRRVARARLVLLPLALFALSAPNLAASFVAQPLAAVLWLAAAAACLRLGMRLPTPAGARWLPDAQRLELPGSWLPLAVIVAVFTLRYVLTVAQLVHPEWHGAAALLLPASAVFGAVTGLLTGRAIALLRLTRATIGGHGSLGRA